MELHPGEEVIYEGHPSWRSTMGFYIMGLIVVAVAAVIGAVASGTGIAVAAAAAALVLVLLIGWLRRVTTSYFITTRRLQIRRGILSRHVEETRVERIVDVSVHQTFLDRILAIGTVDFDNASAQQGDLFRFHGVGSPNHVVRAIDEVHEKAASAAAQQPEGT